jgi:signal transduction histidine kinase
VSQALGVIVMQAGGAGSVPVLEEQDAKAVLATIEQTGRQAFAEMRRLVGVLRDDDEAAALAPQPTVGEIPALLARLASAGLNVDLEIEGTRREAPAGVELSAYRIVQEALTNTLNTAALGMPRSACPGHRTTWMWRSATTARRRCRGSPASTRG